MRRVYPRFYLSYARASGYLGARDRKNFMANTFIHKVKGKISLCHWRTDLITWHKNGEITIRPYNSASSIVRFEAVGISAYRERGTFRIRFGPFRFQWSDCRPIRFRLMPLFLLDGQEIWWPIEEVDKIYYLANMSKVEVIRTWKQCYPKRAFTALRMRLVEHRNFAGVFRGKTSYEDYAWLLKVE